MDITSKVNKDIHSRKPVNKLAAKVFFSGVHYECGKSIQTIHLDHPPQMRSPLLQEIKSPSWVNLTGKKSGRFTVIGISKNRNGWVVRCSCGMYSIRSAKAIKNPNNIDDCCEECRQLKYLKRNSTYRHCGKDYV